jgi:hypothetical protein
MPDIRAWLEGIGLGQYVEAFEAEQIEFEDLAKLDVADLKEIGLPIGPESACSKLSEHRSRLQGGHRIRCSGNAPIRSLTVTPGRQLTVLFCDMVGFTELASRDVQKSCSKLSAPTKTPVRCHHSLRGPRVPTAGRWHRSFFGYPLAHEGEAGRPSARGWDHRVARQARRSRCRTSCGANQCRRSGSGVFG